MPTFSDKETVTPTITSLALLKVNSDLLGKDYFENFVPMAAECLRRSHDSHEDVVSVTELQAQLRSQFGLQLPQSAVSTILNRLRKHGYVRLEGKVCYRDVEELEELNFSKDQQRVRERHEFLVREFVDFCSRQLGKDLSPEDGYAALQHYLEENQLLVVDAVKPGGTVVPRPDRTVENAEFLVASFVRYLQKEEHIALRYLATVVKGHMLANAIFLPDPGSASRRFRNTEIYFDTPFLLDALGHGGESQRESCQELLELLYETGAELRCFDHTRDEVRGVLQQCARLMREGHGQGTMSGPGILRNFRSKGLSSTDVVMKFNNLEKDLGVLRIKVVDKPEYDSRHQIDEDTFRKEIEKSVRYLRERQISRDVDSMSAILRLRKGKTFAQLEECRALFVTTNSNLAEVTRRFFSDGSGAGSVSPCLTDYALTNLLWLKKPTAAPGLPRKRVIADCYAATRPSEHLWGKFLQEIERLRERGEVDADEYYLLRHSMEAETALMEATMGREELFTQGTIPEILDRWRHGIEAKKQSEVDAERASKEETERKLEAERKREREREARRQERIRANARKVARWLVRTVLVVTLGLLVLGSAYAFPWNLPEPSVVGFRYLLAPALLLLFLLSVLNLVFGTTLLSVLRRLEAALARWIERLLLMLTGEG